ncbi:hypothetical protein [Helicobacter mehlei]|uniref:Uncharacterized protein n=1 Tax=Helicobacter mehlei TaxID=2316080 RepID=A0A553UGS7_9HELI|nr:hypothetical protein [Helicobacter mehlei]TSA79419.1 hypothetical protein FNE76_07970 [Helicobacter mehlei]
MGLAEMTQRASQALKENAQEVLERLNKTPNGTKTLLATQGYKQTESAQEDSPPKRDFSPFIIEENQGNMDAPIEGQASLPPSTGIKQLDSKIKGRNLSLFDYYMAKNYLGINLGVFLGGSLELNQKVANRTKATSDIYETIKALDLGDNIINKAQKNSGLFNGLLRKANQLTSGVVPLGAELAQTDTAVNQYTYSTARALTNGKVTNQTLDDLKHITRIGFRGAKEYTARLGETQNINLNYLTSQLHNLQALGGKITPDMLGKLAEYRLKARYIQESGGDIDLRAYNKLGGQ